MSKSLPASPAPAPQTPRASGTHWTLEMMGTDWKLEVMMPLEEGSESTLLEIGDPQCQIIPIISNLRWAPPLPHLLRNVPALRGPVGIKNVLDISEFGNFQFPILSNTIDFPMAPRLSRTCSPTAHGKGDALDTRNDWKLGIANVQPFPLPIGSIIHRSRRDQTRPDEPNAIPPADKSW